MLYVRLIRSWLVWFVLCCFVCIFKVIGVALNVLGCLVLGLSVCLFVCVWVVFVTLEKFSIC